MSQKSFLDSVVTWDERRCRQDLKEALPKLISLFQESEAIHEELGILKIVCLSFMPLVPVEDVEEMVFSPVTVKIYGVLDKLLASLNEMCKQSGMVVQVKEMLQMLGDVLDCYTLCIKHVLDEGRQPTVNPAHMHSLPYGAIHLLKGTYNHCKSSVDAYGDMLSSVSELLSKVFKKAHALQVDFLCLLEKIAVSEPTPIQELEDLCNIFDGLFELCQLVCTMDVKLICSFWKHVSRFYNQQMKNIQFHIDINPVAAHLCQVIEMSYCSLFQLVGPPSSEASEEPSLSQGDSAAFQKTLKVVNYYLRILVSLLRGGTWSSCMSDLIKMMITLYSHMPPCLGAPLISEQQSRDIRQHVLNSVEPIIDELITNLNVFVQEIPFLKDYDPCAQLLVRMKIVDNLVRRGKDGAFVNWMLPNMSYSVAADDEDLETVLSTFRLDEIFEAFSHCYVELGVPVMVEEPGGPSAGSQSLYEYTCTHLCRFFVYLFDDDLSPEEFLLCKVVSENFYVSCLATDIWCFLARYGTGEMCYQQTCTLMDLCLSLEGHLSQSVPRQNLVRLLSRLVKFLAADHQMNFVQKYPPASNLPVYKDLSLSGFPVDLRTKITVALYSEGLRSMQDFLVAIDKKRYCDLASLVPPLQCLATMLDQPSPDVCSKLEPNTNPFVGQVWSILDTGHWSTDPLLTTVFVAMVKLFILNSQKLENLYILKVLSVATNSVRLAPTCLKLATVRFLHHCGNIKFEPDVEQAQILSRIPQVFHSLLSDTNCLIYHVAMETFTEFAERTPYEDLVPQCLGNSEKLQDSVVAFLNKTVHESSNYNQLDYLHHQKTIVPMNLPFDLDTRERADNKPSYEDLPVEEATIDDAGDKAGDMLDQIGTMVQPVSKRKRAEEDEAADQVQLLVSNLSHGVTQLETLHRSRSLPVSSADNIRSIVGRLSTILQELG